MARQFFLSVLFSGILAFPLLAQQQEGGQRDRQEPRQPTTPQPQQPSPQREQRRPDMPRPIFISGQVVLSDGSKLPATVRVGLVCNGSLKRETYTSLNGEFSFDVGSRNYSAPIDASVGSPEIGGFGSGFGRGGFGEDTFGGVGGSDPFGRVDLTGCELKAFLPGYQSSAIQLGIRRALDNPEVGVIYLHRMADVEGTTVSVRTLGAPKEAKKAFENAQNELKKSKPKTEKVTKELEKAVAAYPEFAEAWHLLGMMRVRSSDLAGARQAFEKAVESDPNYVIPYLALVKMDLDESRFAEAAQRTGTVIQLNPYVTEAYYYQAVAQYYLGQFVLAEQSLREFQNRSDGADQPPVHYLMGILLAEKGDVQSAAAEFRKFLEQAPDAAGAEQIRQQLRLWTEQGLIRASAESQPQP